MKLKISENQMNQLPDGFESFMSDVGQLVHKKIQVESLEKANNAGASVASLFEMLSSACDDQQFKRPDGLGELVDSHQLLLLNLVTSSDDQRSIQRSAGQYAADIGREVESYDKKSVAVAEILLRKLHVLCLESASEQYEEEIRSEEWVSIIADAKAALIESENHWRTNPAA